MGTIFALYYRLHSYWRSFKVYTSELAPQRVIPGSVDPYQRVLLAFLGVLLYVSNESSYWASPKATNYDSRQRILGYFLGRTKLWDEEIEYKI